MKSLQKLILPALVIVVIFLVYITYFAPSSDLGAFADFDINNSAVKDIRVKVLQERGFSNNSFYVVDKAGKVVVVHADNIPPGINTVETVILRGHLNKDSFHAHDVLLD